VFGVGTDLAVSGDAPALDIVYKLTEFGGEGRVKLSVGKRSLPGRKQIFRNYENDIAVGDVIARAEEQLSGTPLLRAVMRGGERVIVSEPLETIRERSRTELARMPEDIRRMSRTSRSYSVTISRELNAFDRRVREEIARTGLQKNA
jgi:nicotinate phosphoribosyltransferase